MYCNVRPSYFVFRDSSLFIWSTELHRREQKKEKELKINVIQNFQFS